jgi:hypothetical protein
MTDKGKIEVLQKFVQRRRLHSETKKALNEEIKENVLAMENEINEGGDMKKAKRALMKEKRLVEERKSLNKKITALGAEIEDIILGEGKHDGSQLDFDDYAAQVEREAVEGAPEEEEGTQE